MTAICDARLIYGRGGFHGYLYAGLEADYKRESGRCIFHDNIHEINTKKHGQSKISDPFSCIRHATRHVTRYRPIHNLAFSFHPAPL